VHAVRITFKQGALHYTSLDTQNLRQHPPGRAAFGLAWISPATQAHLAAALPLGFAARAEVMDVWLNEDVEDVLSPLQANVPPGLTILQAIKVDEREPSLQSQVIAAKYQVEITAASHRLNRKVLPLWPRVHPRTSREKYDCVR
jgi:uncharacterized protein (DUF2344 family)